MLALIGNLDLLELVLIAAVALMVFGKRLPEVTMRGAAQLMKLRREVTRMWREAGLEEELRKVKRDLDREVPKHLPTPDELIRQAELEEERERQQALLAADHAGVDEGDEYGEVESDPELAGAVAPEDSTPLDPLSREALADEPSPWRSSAEQEPAQEGPGAEDAMVDPVEQARVEPAADDDEDAAQGEKESA